MNNIILFFKGFIIGIAKILPGVSGAVLSISFGVYERLLGILGNPLKIKFEDLKFIFFLLGGAGVGISLLCNFVLWCLDKWHIHTMLLFIGLIVGGIPEITDEIKHKISFKNTVIFILGFFTVMILTNLGSTSGNGNHYFLMGAIESLTTIVPGISGTAIFMALGWYESLLGTINSILSFSASFNIAFLFILGFLISTILISKVLGYLFNRYKTETYFCVLGFMSSSLISMIFDLTKNSYNNIELFCGVLLSCLGYFITLKMNKLFSKF